MGKLTWILGISFVKDSDRLCKVVELSMQLRIYRVFHIKLGRVNGSKLRFGDKF